VVDVPPLLSLEVTEHRAQRKRCSGCGRSTTASFPTEVSATVGYGPRIKALTVYLMNYQLLPYERTSELLEDLFGEPAPGAGTLHSALRSCFEGLEDTEEAIKAGLSEAQEVAQPQASLSSPTSRPKPRTARPHLPLATSTPSTACRLRAWHPSTRPTSQTNLLG
jgi:transposase